MISVVTTVQDTQLAVPTPCPDASVGDLIDHVGVFAVRFTAAARKESSRPPVPPPRPSGANLEAGWRDRISRDLMALADAWHDPQAWEGNSDAGGREMPAEVVGLVALDELIVHGWDIAVAGGQPYDAPSAELDVALGFVASFDAPRDGTLFGPIVAVDDDAPPLDRLLGMTGRDPTWQPSRAGRDRAGQLP